MGASTDGLQRGVRLQELADRNLSKPGELREREEQLLVFQQEPEAMLGDVGHLNRELMPGAADVILVLLN